jgi:MHS family proline/betaine transporter-like MFS transporter
VLSDRVGRKPLLLLGAGGTLVLAWPLFWLIHHDSVLACLVGQMALSVLIGIYCGVIPVTLVEITPARVRCSALSIGYNLCVGVAGGTAPMVATYLIERTHDDLSPAFYLMGAAAVSLAVAVTLRETAHEPLR